MAALHCKNHVRRTFALAGHYAMPFGPQPLGLPLDAARKLRVQRSVILHDAPIWCDPLLAGARFFLGRFRGNPNRSEEHTSELQSLTNLVCRLLLEKKKISRLTPPL